jgi:outer membrane receptor for ferrienterochelin and colicins
MLSKFLFCIAVLLLIYYTGHSQTVTGVIVYNDKTMDGMEMPLSSATVSWLQSSVGTYTDDNGKFTLFHPDSLSKKLIITYVGYVSDTIDADFTTPMKINLKPSITLHQVTIKDNSTTYISTKPINQLTIGSGELLKAACCNLGESFETTPAVDVSYSDAVTGQRQIQLIGLNQTYTQLLIENVSQLNGLAKTFGLDYIPGSWIESMQLTQGVGSVVNGYDALSGAINVELKKPTSPEELFVNLYGNSFGRFEANLNSAHKIDSNWSTILLVHADDNSTKLDVNNNSFLSMPLSKQLHLDNRWLYTSPHIQLRFGVDFLTQNIVGGQVNFNPSSDFLTSPYYGVEVNTTRESGYMKLGYLFPDKKYKSMGLILSAFNHSQQSFFGRTTDTASEKNFSANYIYQTIIGNTSNTIRFGGSYFLDNENENVNFFNGQSNLNLSIYQSVGGAFAEYSYTGVKFSMVAGLRGDYHNDYGSIITPCLFLKYAITKTTTFKLSGGNAFNEPDIITENFPLLASSRQFIITQPLLPDIAWNFGGYLQQAFSFGPQTGILSAELYHTYFIHQVIADEDVSPSEVLFYNASSFATSALIMLQYEPLKNWNILLAYRNNNVQQMESGVMTEKPLAARDKYHISTDYTTANERWKFSVIWYLMGVQRLPNTSQNPADLQLPPYSPVYQMLNAQVTYSLKHFDIYAGSENILNQTQANPIVDPSNPFGQHFDSSITWGPIMGRIFYIGIRLKITGNK